jgi:hypothetical protein
MVDDEFQFVEAFEVRDLGLVSGIDEPVEAGFHERAHLHDGPTQTVPNRRQNARTCPESGSGGAEPSQPL